MSTRQRIKCRIVSISLFLSMSILISFVDNTALASQSWEIVGTPGFSDNSVLYEISLALDSNDTPYIAYHNDLNWKLHVMKYNGNSWEPVGSPTGISDSFTNQIFLTFDSSDTPYVVYCDECTPFGITVMKYTGNTETDNDGTVNDGWEYVGSRRFYENLSGVGWPGVMFQSLAFDNNDTPYVVFQDAYSTNKAIVMRFNGSSWEVVGISGAGISEGGAIFPSIAFDSADVPHVVYVDQAYNIDNSGISDPAWASTCGNVTGITTTMMKYTGNTITDTDGTHNDGWEYVGSPGFSLTIGPGGICTLPAEAPPSIAFDSTNASYAYIGGYYPLSVGSVVMRFNGSTWELVGEYPDNLPGGDSSNNWYRQNLFIDDFDTLYVSYLNFPNKPGVDKNDGSGWEAVGSDSLPAEIGGAFWNEGPFPLTLDSSGNPYVAFKDIANSNKVTVMMFNSTIVTIAGDLDGDEDVDRDDLNILLSYRNQPASECPECDLDGDGMITVLDARRLVTMCTRARCATE